MNLRQFSSKGGKARAKKLTKDQRSQIARKAAAKRWEGHKPDRRVPRSQPTKALPW